MMNALDAHGENSEVPQDIRVILPDARQPHGIVYHVTR
jgi:hypothetical protein